jgi:hypothetical protein
VRCCVILSRTYIVKRILCNAVYTYLKVEMSTCGMACTADRADSISLVDILTYRNPCRCHMSVNCGICTVMGDKYIISVTAAAAAAVILSKVVSTAVYNADNCTGL